MNTDLNILSDLSEHKLQDSNTKSESIKIVEYDGQTWYMAPEGAYEDAQNHDQMPDDVVDSVDRHQAKAAILDLLGVNVPEIETVESEEYGTCLLKSEVEGETVVESTESTTVEFVAKCVVAGVGDIKQANIVVDESDELNLIDMDYDMSIVLDQEPETMRDIAREEVTELNEWMSTDEFDSNIKDALEQISIEDIQELDISDKYEYGLTNHIKNLKAAYSI